MKALFRPKGRGISIQTSKSEMPSLTFEENSGGLDRSLFRGPKGTGWQRLRLSGFL